MGPGKGSDGFRKWKYVISFTLVIVMLTTIFWGMGELGPAPEPLDASEVTITALSTDTLGIELDSAFLLTGSEPMDEKTIKDSLKTNPEFAYRLDKQADGSEYKIIPQEELSPNTIYTLSFDPVGMGYENLSWAFQTKTNFRVIGSLPADRSSHVPVATGIELTFSHENYDSQKINEYFTMSPQTEGTFEKHKKTTVFVPKELQPSTIYTITLKKGLPLVGTSETLKDDYVFSFETAPINQGSTAFEFNMDTALTEFSTTDIPAFSVYFYNQYQSGNNAANTPSLHIDLYRYPDYKDFQSSLAKRDLIPSWSYFAWNGYREELNPQYRIADYDTEFLRVDQYSHYIVFPEELEAGYYAAELKADDAVRQVWFQVSDLAVYQAQGETNTLFWVNDLQTKTPVSDFEVIIDSKNLSTKGDGTGAVLIEEELMGTNRDYALIKSGIRELLVPLEARPEHIKSGSTSKDYWKYFYLDRELYQPEDIINFWGVLSSRDQAGTQPNEITLELRGTDGPYHRGAEDSPILTRKISVKDKTYTGQMKLPVLKPGYYYIQLKIGDMFLLSRGFSVETYQKPSYKLTLTQDKKAIFAGESLGFKAKTAFFEGTPVSGTQLNYNIESSNGTVTTDDKGEAEISYKGFTQQEDYSPYRYVSMWVNAVLPEVGEIATSTDFYVFKSKVYITGEAKRQADSYTLTAKLSEVDLTDINNGQYISEEHFLKDAVANSPIKANLYQEVWTKVESGQQYNFISKQVEKIYHYNYSTKHINEFELITDADGTINHTGELDPENSYYIELTAVDSDDRQFTRRLYVGSDRHNSPDYQHYYLQTSPEIDGYLPGDDVLVTMMVNDRELKAADNSILFYRGQKFIDSHQVTGNPKYGFTFTNENIPNIIVYGVYFDGYTYHEAYSINIPFARDSRALEINIESDRQEYKPGDTVKLEVMVSDANHKPIKGAQVNLNLVDEALFSLREQNVNFLNSLYGDYLYPYLNTRKSHDHPEFRGGAESGGEGGSDRKDFRDTVVFTTIQTDANGKASIEFELPDNLTSWRVTYHAFTDELQAGSGTKQIPVRLPFFIEMTLNNSYLEGDSPLVILRSFGDKLQGAKEVAYTMKLIDPQGKEQTWKENALSFTPLDWKLPELKAGKYSLTVSAAYNGLSDTLTKEFMVVSSFQERTITYIELLQEGIGIEGSQVSPTTVIFSDYEKGQYLRGLYQLAWNNGSRLEQKLTSLEAKKLLQEYFPEEPEYSQMIEDQDSLLLYQKPDGGISILPYGESELTLSAMVASTTPELFDSKALCGYFYRVMEEGQEDNMSLALLGLAALKEPVLLDIKNYLLEKELEPAVRINLALALLDIGDGAYAQEVFQELLTLYSQDLGVVMRINVGRDQDEIIQATTQMALLAARLNQPQKNKLYQYLLENQGKDILNTVEQLQILKYNLKFMKPTPVSFTYELNGEKVNKELVGNDLFKLTLLPEDLQEIRFSHVEGKVGIMRKYTLPIPAGETGDSVDLMISRTYMVDDNKATTFNRSDLIKVVINSNIGDKAPAGLYEIVDILPAGLTHVSQPYNYYEYDKNQTRWDYPSEVNGQKLVFLLGKGNHEITYLARVISPGEFTCEAPVLNNIKNNTIYTSGSKDRIVIE
ncbi:MAG: alpha-2-macroglobulin [Gracilibacter sp. BRH_c7a]|nr:MAG: alpha-2-macroglobulin [Gracilibacter sp. BRH_c7a]